MATLIPALSSCRQRMTLGERRFAERLEDKLENDYLLWYNVPVGLKARHPDFVILHRDRGLIVLEVKDWKLDTIQQVDPKSVTLLTSDGVVEVKNPLEQAREYMFEIVDLLKRDKLLVQQEGNHKGKLAFPYSYGVVFTNITRKQFDLQQGLHSVLISNLVICQDEFYETVESLDFQERLWNLCTYQYGEPLTSTQIDRIRWHIFPEVRIDHQLSFDFQMPTAEPVEVIPDLLKVMDLQQEQLARSLGAGHRVVHGVAGSGKTLILVYRCLHLLQKSEKSLLVLCYNKALAAKLRQMLYERGRSDKVIVRHFHRWCHDLLQRYNIPKPSFNQFPGEAYFNQLVQQVIGAVETTQIPAGLYGAVLIDEGHDFQPEWLKLLVQMVDPETNSLLLLYDDAQSIYGKNQTRKFSFKSVGIQASGRTTILKLNYRNTQEILTVAYRFAREFLNPTESKDEDVPVLIHPESAGRRGPKPELIQRPNFQQEVCYLAQRAQQLHERGVAWNDIAIVYRVKWMGNEVYKWFQQKKLPIEWVNQEGRKFQPSTATIKLVTMHSSKGLEFPVVFIPGIGYMPNQYHDCEDESRLLYVGMTRAIDQLVITCNRASKFTQRLEVILEGMDCSSGLAQSA